MENYDCTFYYGANTFKGLRCKKCGNICNMLTNNLCFACNFEKGINYHETKIPHTCPICHGSGIVSKGFYNRTGQTWTSDGTTEPCRACQGTGVIWG